VWSSKIGKFRGVIPVGGRELRGGVERRETVHKSVCSLRSALARYHGSSVHEG
jgi:hypothetical protein